MPIQHSTFLLPSGAQAVRAEYIGYISKEDAEAWIKQVNPGGPLHGLPSLVISLKLDRVSSEARALFAERAPVVGLDNWRAIVVSNPLARVTANFVARVSKIKKQRLFATEQEALLWLDERVREDAARKPAPT